MKKLKRYDMKKILSTDPRYARVRRSMMVRSLIVVQAREGIDVPPAEAYRIYDEFQKNPKFITK